MQIRNVLVALLGMSLSFNVQAQTDSSAARNILKIKKPVNFTKLELIYKTRTVKTAAPGYDNTGFRLNGADSRQPIYKPPTDSKVEEAYIRINGGEVRKLDKRANILRPYYAKAPLANEQLILMKQQRRRGAVQGWTLVGLGTVATGVGLYSAVNKSDNEDSEYSASVLQTFLRVAPGLAVACAGFALNRFHEKKARKHLEQSLEIYNNRYYKPIKADSTLNAHLNADSTVLSPLTPKN